VSGLYFFHDVFTGVIFEERYDTFVEQIAGMLPIELRSVFVFMSRAGMIDVKSRHHDLVVLNNSPRTLQMKSVLSYLEVVSSNIFHLSPLAKLEAGHVCSPGASPDRFARQDRSSSLNLLLH